jgi:hypothetical protein
MGVSCLAQSDRAIVKSFEKGFGDLRISNLGLWGFQDLGSFETRFQDFGSFKSFGFHDFDM